MKISKRQVEECCWYVSKNYETFCGNCGVFAYALAKVLGFDKCKFAFANNTHYGPDSHYHVAIRYGNTLFDGHGKMSKADLLEWAKDDGLWMDGIDAEPFVEEVHAGEDFEYHIKRGTEWMMEPEAFEKIIRDYFNLEIPDELKARLNEIQEECGCMDLMKGENYCSLCGNTELICA